MSNIDELTSIELQNRLLEERDVSVSSATVPWKLDGNTMEKLIWEPNKINTVATEIGLCNLGLITKEKLEI